MIRNKQNYQSSLFRFYTLNQRIIKHELLLTAFVGKYSTLHQHEARGLLQK